MKLSAQYSGLSKSLRQYATIYGGIEGVCSSPYFHVSVLLLVITCPFWVFRPWWEQVLSVLPNMLGFTLGGFAIFLAFGDENFKALISGKSEPTGRHSPYLSVSSTFLHFILVQALGLLFAVIAKALAFDLPIRFASLADLMLCLSLISSAFGYWLFLYGLCLIIAAAIATFKVANWYDDYQTLRKSEDDQTPHH